MTDFAPFNRDGRRYVYLTEPTLGLLDIGPLDLGAGLRGCNAQGYVVSGWQVGFPAVRPVARNRALADGTVDDTRFVGARAISMNIVIDASRADPQETVDRLMPYLSPRYRPRLHWTIPGSEQERSALVRGQDAPLQIAGRTAHVVTASWVAPNGVLESAEEQCEIINPGSDTEDGRRYDLVFDRVYPPSLGIGDRLVVNEGTAVAEWTATIFGPCVNPALIINGVPIRFDRSGGLELTGGTSVTIDSRQRTILLNNDPTQSRYEFVNFTDWAWDDVRLRPGENIVRFEGDVLDAGSQVQFCWRSAWL
jgi:hypothetical protein